MRISGIGTTSVVYECTACRLPDETLMATAAQRLVLVKHETRLPAPVPEELRTVVCELEEIDFIE